LINPVQQSEAAERVIKEGLNVRQAEGLVAKLQTRGDSKKTKTPLPTDAHVANLENKIREKLGTKVSLRYAKGKGSLEISFFSDAELEGVLQALGVNAD
jgi:ParB family chromosome partitioning protein